MDVKKYRLPVLDLGYIINQIIISSYI